MPDGLMAPSPPLVYLVTGQYDIESFYQNGAQGAECIKSILKNNGLDINAFTSILDFGCGCGRIMRFWNILNGPELFGVDYNRRLINWCRRSLTFAEFEVNNFYSRLDYEDDKFDFIYAISVFTHLTKPLQEFWIGELTRILKPECFLLVTTHGRKRLHQLTSNEREKFESGELVLSRKRYPETNLCAAYHPEQYVRQNWTKEITLVDFISGGARDANQDAYLFRKSATGGS
jgi:SAM-dependent methyltransferase